MAHQVKAIDVKPDPNLSFIPETLKIEENPLPPIYFGVHKCAHTHVSTHNKQASK